jgi:hypothetical protein
VEYVGDGGGSAKPWPVGVAPPGDQASAVAALLRLDCAPLTGLTRRKLVNWYRLPAVAYTTTLLVCLQPTADEDADLYVVQGGGAYPAGANTIGYSARLPTASGGAVTGGYAPDWVAFTGGPTSGYPAAQVDVYGCSTGTSAKHYRIEAHEVWTLPLGGGCGGTLSQYQSHWWSVDAVNGTHYTLHLVANSGDPDVYVYQDKSAEFVGSSAAVGGGEVGFTAAETSKHFVRVYGFSACGYGLTVTTP